MCYILDPHKYFPLPPSLRPSYFRLCWSPDSHLVVRLKQEIVNRVSDLDILNKDVRLDNFLIRESALVKTEETEPEPYPVVLVDLASCRFRQSDETDDAWKTDKHFWDESGALGYVLARKVEDQVGKGIWKFEWKNRYFEDIDED